MLLSFMFSIGIECKISNHHIIIRISREIKTTEKINRAETRIGIIVFNVVSLLRVIYYFWRKICVKSLIQI